jgi:hypothetical protein
VPSGKTTEVLVRLALGDGVAGAERVRAALSAAGGLIGPRERVTSLLLAGWLEGVGSARSAGSAGQGGSPPS